MTTTTECTDAMKEECKRMRAGLNEVMHLGIASGALDVVTTAVRAGASCQSTDCYAKWPRWAAGFAAILGALPDGDRRIDLLFIRVATLGGDQLVASPGKSISAESRRAVEDLKLCAHRAVERCQSICWCIDELIRHERPDLVWTYFNATTEPNAIAAVLRVVAGAGEVDRVSSLIARGATPSAIDDAFLVATRAGRVEVVRCMVSHLSDPIAGCEAAWESATDDVKTLIGRFCTPAFRTSHPPLPAAATEAPRPAEEGAPDAKKPAL